MKVEFKIDFDTECKQNVHVYANELYKRIRFVSYTLKIKFEKAEVFETKHGFHIYLTAHVEQNIHPLELLLLHACLMSDYRHVIYCLRLYKKGVKDWLRLWKVKQRGRHVVLSKEVKSELAIKFERLLNERLKWI